MISKAELKIPVTIMKCLKEIHSSKKGSTNIIHYHGDNYKNALKINLHF